MADFYQNGIITTLHNLRQRSLEELEGELRSFKKKRPMALVLPSLFSELEGDALPNIVQELSKVDYLDDIVIGLDRASEDQYRQALEFFKPLNQSFKVLWNDGPRLQAIDAKLRAKKLAPKELGKGRNVWFCFGYVLAAERAKAIALHDCDIVTYDRSLLARLLYPVANPNFNYKFCKGFYARVASGKMHGRVTRLLVTPLVRALKKVYGQNDYLDYIDSFRYPLAGEFSFSTDVINDLRIPSDWGLEIGVLSELNRNYANNRICQADIADTYDHKHQSLSPEDTAKGLSKMSIDICKALFRKLATNGVVFNAETFRAIKATYYRIALDFVETYYNDAQMNGLNLDIHAEEAAIELFAENVLNAGHDFLENPMETPFIPSWNRAMSALPDILDELSEAVTADMQEYSDAI
ncbi:glycosyl transferase [Arenicella xantha]|uniref:Glucosyl-3-phosphoglycerate synthase n=1 Tax=Arenicella xantha TaxID=644221 RepID=A0A395JH69_9GAMM|nr:glycosyl transferase [Arenicella xantha]RBP49310.1 glucosyl-3-phosphoglycerate synthase [Arenicella xantha]